MRYVSIPSITYPVELYQAGWWHTPPHARVPMAPAASGALPAARLREKEPAMKWMTRERARVDRIACPWLISRFIDPEPEFLYVPADQVRSAAATRGAIPYDIPDVELGHRGPLCSFDAFMRTYGLLGSDPALDRLALIV